mmetsp:Transcript_8666/g.23308  ORF Transcript_8666/g.23308 Transcript_8666/m.23308 type:complete len:249 (+) Transcript_8666:548-1294(+)
MRVGRVDRKAARSMTTGRRGRGGLISTTSACLASILHFILSSITTTLPPPLTSLYLLPFHIRFGQSEREALYSHTFTSFFSSSSSSFSFSFSFSPLSPLHFAYVYLTTSSLRRGKVEAIPTFVMVGERGRHHICLHTCTRLFSYSWGNRYGCISPPPQPIFRVVECALSFCPFQPRLKRGLLRHQCGHDRRQAFPYFIPLFLYISQLVFQPFLLRLHFLLLFRPRLPTQVDQQFGLRFHSHLQPLILC